MKQRRTHLVASSLRLRDERGATIVLIAAAMTALVSAAALAIDIGMLVTARSEAQRTADAAALACAGQLILTPTQEDEGRDAAIAIGGQNTIMGDPAEILPEDVVIDLDAGRCEVTAWRSGDRGTAVPTWFARVFGRDLVDVSARAVAAVTAGHGATCVKPWAVPDGWQDTDGDFVFDAGEAYDPDQYGYGSVEGSNFRNTAYYDNGIDPAGTTYVEDRGRPLVLKPGSPEDSPESGWYFPWDMPQPDGGPDAGGDKYRWNIANCNPSLIQLGVEYNVENGNMKGPTSQGLQDLIDLDPTAYWDPVASEVVSDYQFSPRIVFVPLFSPEYPVEPGKRPIVFVNITGFFIVEVQGGGNVIGRFLDIPGVGVSGGTPGLDVKFPQLIE